MVLRINNNPYPTRYRLPGDKTPARQILAPIEGAARRGIVHALTYHELPLGINDLIDRLPPEERFSGLNPLQKSYLSFTVYSLKQMVAAGTISADMAWCLFNREDATIDRVDKKTFLGLRQDFWREVGRQTNQREDTTGLLRFEFFARAGEGGLAQFERYGEWAKNLAFRGKDCLTDDQQDEYRKALWLEMRLIEDRVGINGDDKGLSRFELDGLGGKYRYGGLRGSIDLFSLVKSEATGKYSERPIDSTIKAEIGHWLFEQFRPLHYEEGRPKHTAISELADRTNIAGFTPRVNFGFGENVDADNLPPEIRCFREGGYYLQGLFVGGIDHEAAYPIYPVVDWYSAIEEEHECAELTERRIRSELAGAVVRGEIRPPEVYQLYRQAVVYASLKNFELIGLTEAERSAYLRDEMTFRPGQISSYFRTSREKAQAYWENVLATENWCYLKGLASRNLISLGSQPADSAEHRRLRAWYLIGSLQELSEFSKDIFDPLEQIKLANLWEELGKLGELAAPLVRDTVTRLEPLLQGDNIIWAARAAKALIVLKKISRDSVEHRQMQAVIARDAGEKNE